MLNSPSPKGREAQPSDEAPLRPSQHMLLNLTPSDVDIQWIVTNMCIKQEVLAAAVSGDWSTVRTLISRKVGLRIVRDSMVDA